MFVTADKLLNLTRGRSVHAVSYGWDGFSPEFLVYSREGGLEKLPLDEFAFALSDEQLCVGSFRDGAYRPCPFHRHVEYTDQCDFCSRSIIPIQRCLFEPICDGHLCDWDLCKRKHLIYIAFYGEKLKVGMTSSSRIGERLVEQGADAYFTFGEYPNRKAAREMEKRISNELSIPQMHRSTELLDDLWRGPDFERIGAVYERISTAAEGRYAITPGELRPLDRYPIEQPLPERPRLAELASIHEGKVIGLKGRFAVYESSGLRAVSLSSATSRRMVLL